MVAHSVVEVVAVVSVRDLAFSKIYQSSAAEQLKVEFRSSPQLTIELFRNNTYVACAKRHIVNDFTWHKSHRRV